MLTITEDRATRELLWLFTGLENSDEDFRAYCDSIVRAKADYGGERDFAAITLVDPGNPKPSAYWRKEIAEVTRTVPEGDIFFVLVSPSTLIRGALIAVNWIRPPPFKFTSVSTFDDALHWLGAERGGTTSFPRLLAEARRAAGRLTSAAS